jgi:hypothetical protein
MTTDIIHRSKIGLEILIPIIVVIGTVTTIMVINLIWVGLVVCSLVILLVTNIYTGTYYKITNDNHLFIKCGFIETFDIEINDIEWIKATKELLSSPALSIDRLEINYKGGRVLISPKDKKKFMDDLRKVNPKL